MADNNLTSIETSAGITVGTDLTVNGNTTLGDASTDTVTLTGRLILRGVNGVVNIPGTKQEVVYNTANDKVYVCTVTHGTAATWVALN